MRLFSGYSNDIYPYRVKTLNIYIKSESKDGDAFLTCLKVYVKVNEDYNYADDVNEYE